MTCRCDFMSGFLARVRMHKSYPAMGMLSVFQIEREEALERARKIVQSFPCGEPRQILFVRSDGEVELWERELQ